MYAPLRGSRNNNNEGPPKVQYFATFVGTLNSLCSGMHYGWWPVSAPYFNDKNSYMLVSKTAASWIIWNIVLGTICGSIIAGLILNKFGRKNIILLASYPFFISWIMIAFVQSVDLLIFARFIAGISNGFIYCSIPIYLGEISHPRIRGFTGCCITFGLISGMLIITILGTYLSITIVALISSVIQLVVLLLSLRIPESPYYSLMTDNLKRVRKSLRILLNRTDGSDEVLKRLIKAVEGRRSILGKCLVLFTIKSNIRAFILILGILTVRQFAGYIFIFVYIQIIIRIVGYNISNNLTAIIYFSLQTIVLGCSSVIVDKFGRRPLLIISIIGVALILLIVDFCFLISHMGIININSFGWISIAGFVIYVVVSSMGLEAIPTLLLGEMFPTNVKALAVSIANVYECLITVTLSMLSEFSENTFSLQILLFVYAILSSLGFIFIKTYMPETKAKTLEEIQKELKFENTASSGDLGSMLELQELSDTMTK